MCVVVGWCQRVLLLAGVHVCCYWLQQEGTVEQEALAAADGLSKQMQVRVKGQG